MPEIEKNFSKFYDENVEKIYRFVFLKVNSQDIAEDITSEAFLRVWEVFKSERPIEKPPAFLYQVARNLVIDHYREKGRTQILPVENNPIIDPRPSLEDKAGDNLELDRIKLALANLKDGYQEMIIWHYIDDLSVPEIADLTGKSEGAVRVALHRALNSLRETISDKAENSEGDRIKEV